MVHGFNFIPYIHVYCDNKLTEYYMAVDGIKLLPNIINENTSNCLTN